VDTREVVIGCLERSRTFALIAVPKSLIWIKAALRVFNRQEKNQDWKCPVFFGNQISILF